MTRRNIVFINELDQIFTTPEFNGDKKEFDLRGLFNTCLKNWDEILREFEGVFTLKEFKKANEIAQKYYINCFGETEILPVVKINKLIDVKNDEVYLIEGGEIKRLS